MSQTGNKGPERGNVIDDRLNQLPPVSVPPSQAETNFGDSSGPLFAMYSKIGEEEDNQMAERWQKDADGIVIFTGLFSAVVGAVVVVSVQDLRPNSQDTSAFYLENIYLLLANPNQTPSSVARPPPFFPPTSAIWVNSLWFLSLVISLTCAMLATSLQQWARRYVKVTQPARCSPHKRARIRAFFAHGVDKFHVPWAVESLPALIHLSLFLFFAGLLVYLFDINHTVFTAVSCWVALLSILYGCITLMPIFRHDSPYYAPLSSAVWLLYTSMLYAVLKLRLRFFSRERFHRKHELKKSHRQRIFGGVEGAAEEAASELSSEIDARVLEQTVGALAEDDALEEFYESIPGFYKSDVVKDLRQCLPRQVQSKILGTMVGFLRRTLLSNSTSASMKNRRLAIYINAASEVNTSIYALYGNIVSGSLRGAIQSVELGHFLISWEKNSSGPFHLYIQGIIALIVASVRERNDSWVALAVDYLGVPEPVIRGYLHTGIACYSPFSTTSLATCFTLIGCQLLPCDYFLILTYVTPFPQYSTISVPCGTKLFERHRTADLMVVTHNPYCIFGLITSFCIKAPMIRFLRSLIPRPTSTTFSTTYRPTYSATTLTIAWTRRTSSTRWQLKGSLTVTLLRLLPSLSLFVTPLWTPSRLPFHRLAQMMPLHVRPHRVTYLTQSS